jgi:hypothetical protein
MLPAAEAIFPAMANVEPRDRVAFLDERCAGDGVAPRRRGARRRARRPGEEFLDRRLPTLDMAVDGPLQPGTTSADSSCCTRSVGRHGRVRRAAGSPAPHGGHQGAQARLPPSEILRRFEHEAEMLGRLLHPASRSTPFIRATVRSRAPGDGSPPVRR